MPDFLEFIVLSLAAYRITRLFIDDTITEGIRKRTTYRLDPRGKLKLLLDCYWCTGWWICVLIFIGYWAAPGIVPFLCLPFALSSVVGFLSLHDGE